MPAVGVSGFTEGDAALASFVSLKRWISQTNTREYT
jgi:hypothetical protein